jgi:hypothetical protein
MDRALDAVEWSEIATPADLAPGEVYATHSGNLTIGSVTLRVYQLSNGERVIDGDDLSSFFGFEP